MSVVRKHFWIEVSRAPGGCCWPRKYGLNGCIPAVVSSTDGSRVAGTSEADGTAWCPRSTKWSVKLLAIARESIMAGRSLVLRPGGDVRSGERKASQARIECGPHIENMGP